MKKSTLEKGLDRRSFLKVSAGAGIVTAGLAHGQEQADAVVSTTVPPPPTHAREAAEHSGGTAYTPEQEAEWFVDNPGSDFMVDVIKQLDMDFMALNPGSTFRGLQESIINYGGNRKPELITVNHEGIGVSLAQGYYKAAGKPMSVLVHGSVGLQHTPMGIYSAWCDRVPMIVLVGNHNDAAERTNQNHWLHSGADLPAMVRDFTKWDDTCQSLGHFAQSMTRAYKIATTPPMGPVVIVIDANDQEQPIEGRRPRIPKLTESIPPQADQSALDELAEWLVAAGNPMFIAERMAHGQAGVDALVEIAELLQAGVVDGRARVNFPTEHHLFAARADLADADLIVGLEVTGPVVGRPDPGVKVASIGVDQYAKANFQNFEPYSAPDMTIVGDAQSSLPYLTEAVRKRIGSMRKSKLDERERFWRDKHFAAREATLEAAARGWNHSPVTTARLYMETYNAIKHRDWSMVSLDRFQSSWGSRLWPINRYHQFHGSSGSAAIGYGAPASVGAALGHRDNGVLPVNFQRDGDLMFYPGALWTAAHHNVPLLCVMHNNRAYHAETMIVQRTAAERRRGLDGSARVGTVMDDPAIDFAGLARSLGVWSAGTIHDPGELAPALKRALQVIDAGEPALIDVYCPGR